MVSLNFENTVAAIFLFLPWLTTTDTVSLNLFKERTFNKEYPSVNEVGSGTITRITSEEAMQKEITFPDTPADVSKKRKS